MLRLLKFCWYFRLRSQVHQDCKPSSLGSVQQRAVTELRPAKLRRARDEVVC